MQTILNSNEHYYLLEARRSKKFKTLDDKVRVMSIELGKGKGNQKEYEKLKADRDKMLNDFIKDNAPVLPKIEFGDKTEKALATTLDSYCVKFPNTKKINIVFKGPTGTGKTYCAKVIAKKLRQRGFNVYLDSAYNLIKQVRMDELPECDLLIIDDLGSEPDQKNTNEYIYTIIAERYENNKPFIITTNFSQEHIKDTYEERIYGRIFDKNKTAVIEFKGQDLRI